MSGYLPSILVYSFGRAPSTQAKHAFFARYPFLTKNHKGVPFWGRCPFMKEERVLVDSTYLLTQLSLPHPSNSYPKTLRKLLYVLHVLPPRSLSRGRGIHIHSCCMCCVRISYVQYIARLTSVNTRKYYSGVLRSSVYIYLTAECQLCSVHLQNVTPHPSMWPCIHRHHASPLNYN